jgi:VanZ family protein
MKKVIYFIFILVWMGVIFSVSNQEADDSTLLSDGFIENTIGNVYKVIDNDVTDDNLILIKKKYSHPVRKMAHFTIYLILGLFVFNFFKLFNFNAVVCSLLLCFLYACSDEVHQLFVMGRSCEFLDVLIDTTGSFIGIMIYNFFYKKLIVNRVFKNYDKV